MTEYRVEVRDSPGYGWRLRNVYATKTEAAASAKRQRASGYRGDVRVRRVVIRNPSRRLTKAQKKANASKRAKQRRVALALKKFLHAQNPAVKYDGAAIVKLKGGAVRITPIKANAGGLGRVLDEYKHQRRGGTPRLAAVRRAVRSTRKNPKRRSR